MALGPVQRSARKNLRAARHCSVSRWAQLSCWRRNGGQPGRYKNSADVSDEAVRPARDHVRRADTEPGTAPCARRLVEGRRRRHRYSGADCGSLAAASNKAAAALERLMSLAVTAARHRLCARTEPAAELDDGRRRAASTQHIAIRQPPEAVYEFWRRFENLPTFMYHLDSVRTLSATRSHWVVKAPAGARVSGTPTSRG